MFVGVGNEQPLCICAWVGMATVLAYARITHHCIYLGYRVCMVYDHVYSMLFVQGNLNLATKYQLNKNYISVNSGH